MSSVMPDVSFVNHMHLFCVINNVENMHHDSDLTLDLLNSWDC